MGDYCSRKTVVAQISGSGFWIHVHLCNKNCISTRCGPAHTAQPLSAFMWVPHSGYSPTHGSLGWPPLNPNPARSCWFAAGLNTAHCVSAPSQAQTVPTNVLLIRWLNYSCKNNVDISLKIALCQILLAVIGPQPLLSNSPVWTPPSTNSTTTDPVSLSISGSSHAFPHPSKFFSPSYFLLSFMSQAETQANCERSNIPQISSGGVFSDLDADRKTMKSSVECENVFLNDKMIAKDRKKKHKRKAIHFSRTGFILFNCLFGFGDLTFGTSLLLYFGGIFYYHLQAVCVFPEEGDQIAWDKTQGCMVDSVVSVTVTEDQEFKICQKSGPGKTQQHHERSQGRKAK